MREIEFRGRTEDGKILYGDLIHVEFRSYFVNGASYQVVPTVNGERVEEYAQFVGRDKHGARVFEGDILLDDVENEYVAEIYMRPSKIAELVLKR